MDNTSEIYKYYATHPNASIGDYLDYVKSCEADTREKENERQKNCTDWYKALAGRYFILDFNGNSFCAVKVDSWPSTEFKNRYDCYNINLRYKGMYFESRDINRYWFNNPYERPYIGRGTNKCKEITKEQYDSIVEKAKQIKEFVETTINTVVRENNLI